MTADHALPIFWGVGEFIAACCVLNPTVEVRGGELYAAYRAWAELD